MPDPFSPPLSLENCVSGPGFAKKFALYSGAIASRLGTDTRGA